MSSLQAKNRLQKPFTQNSKIVFPLQLGGKIRRGALIVVGQITISGGTTNGTVSGLGGPTNLISRVRVRATPAGGSRYTGGLIVDSTPQALLRESIIFRGGKFFADMNGSTLGSGAAGVYQVYLPIPIYWADANQRSPLATALNTDPGTYASVQVEIDTANLAACFTGNDRAMDTSQLLVEWVDERVDTQGDTSILYQESHLALIAATNKRMLDDAMPRDGSFMSWFISAEQGNPAFTLSEGLLNKVYAEGPTLLYEKYALDVREADFADDWFDPSLTPTGLYRIDFTDGVVVQNTVPAGALDIYFDVNNVSGANLDALEFFTKRVLAPAPAPAASSSSSS